MDPELRYLAFQVFLGTADPAIPFETVIQATPKAKILALVQDMVQSIGQKGGKRAKLAFIVGPLAPDHTDAEAL